MIELIKSEAKHNSEFRERTDRNFAKLEERLNELENRESNRSGKLAMVAGFFSLIGSGFVTFIAKYFGGQA